MEETLVLVVDYEVVCRVCLQARGALSDLFTADAEPPLPQQIRALSDVAMSETDNLPKKICHKCRYIVELCYDLRNTVIKSNKLLCDSVEADDLIDDGTQVFKNEDRDMDIIYDDDNLENIMHSQGEEVIDESFLCEDIQSSRSLKRRLDSTITFEDRDDDIAENEIELCADNSNAVIECKIELPENYDFISETERKDYVSSKDVTLDEVSFDEAETSQIQLLPDISDDGGSVTDMALSMKLKDPSNNIDRPSRQQTCQLCLEVFSDRTSLVSHIVEHYKESNLTPYISTTKPYICQECNLNFSAKIELISHHRRHLNINPFMCKVEGCNFDIRTKEALRHHMYTHVVKKYVCNQCGARYRRKIEILRHRVRHLDEGRQFRCGLCWVICKNRLSLKAHLKNHEIGRRFKCDFAGCPKAFFSNSDLVIHSRSHSNDKCYKCPLCVCAYTSQSQLNRHLRRHNKPGPTKCDKCSETFNDYGSFCNHRIATHGEWQPHRCKGCNQGYQSEQQLEKHLSRCDIALKMKSLDGIDLEMKEEDREYDDQNNVDTR